MLASLVSVSLYFVMLIYLLADWDSLSAPLLVSWTSINFLGLVIFFYLLLRWVNQRLVASTSRRTHSARGRWSPPLSAPASPSELGRRRVPSTTWTRSGCRSALCRCRLLVYGWGRAEIESPYPILQILMSFKLHLNFDNNFPLRDWDCLKLGFFLVSEWLANRNANS